MSEASSKMLAWAAYIFLFLLAFAMSHGVSFKTGLGAVVASLLGFHLVYAFIFNEIMQITGAVLEPGKNEVYRIFLFSMGIAILVVCLNSILGGG
tara:strand:+ start:182 stop:466 length:285 start_codon:yes stop_codon:yes gene_type:complete